MKSLSLIRLIRNFFLILTLSLVFPTLKVVALEKNQFTGSPPIFNGEESPFKGVYIPNARYFFKFSHPEKAQTSIAQIRLQQQPNLQEIALNLPETRAFKGTPNDRGDNLEIASATQDPTSGLVTISFTTPIPPGTDFTVALQTYQNPRFSGIYQYTVFAVPLGTNSVPMNLGVARFHFYSSGSR